MNDLVIAAAMKAVSALCEPADVAMNFLTENNFTMVWYGDTTTPGVSDSLWVNEDGKVFKYVRWVAQSAEGCQIATGFNKVDILGKKL